MLKEKDYKITAGGRIKNDYKSPYGPYIPTPSDEKITPIPEYQAETDEILAEIQKNVRKQSYLGWFDGKIAISYSDSKRIEVSCTYSNKEWVEENYKSLIERLSGKKVSLVVIFRKRVTDGEELVGAV